MPSSLVVPGTDLNNWNTKQELMFLGDLGQKESLWFLVGGRFAKAIFHHNHLSEQVHLWNVDEIDQRDPTLSKGIWLGVKPC
jgi:hypothetical protein